MKQEKPLDITKHFALHGEPIEPSPDKLFGDGGTDTFEGMTPHPSWQLAQPIDVPEPILRAHDVYKYGSIVLAFFFCAIFASLIGEAIGHIAYALLLNP